MPPKQGFPLESNPDVMQTYVQTLGVDMSILQFHDVLSTEEWALEMIPNPVFGVLMLFPIKPASEEARNEEKARILANEQSNPVSPNVYYMKQTVGNACGTVGLLHCVINARNQLTIQPGSYLEKFIASTLPMTPDEKAEYLAMDDDIDIAHEAAASEGQSEQISEEVDTHFVCFTHVDGSLYELDGRKAFPINHGATSPSTLLADACRVVKEFMDRDPAEMRFTIVALAAVALDD